MLGPRRSNDNIWHFTLCAIYWIRQLAPFLFEDSNDGNIVLPTLTMIWVIIELSGDKLQRLQQYFKDMHQQS